jgi:hypothetical protein
MILAVGTAVLPGTVHAQGSGRLAIVLAAETGTATHAMLYSRETYAGRAPDGVPYYTERPFSAEERRLLRNHFGIEEPGRLYLSDSSTTAYLQYDTQRDPGASRLVRTYRVGAESIRWPGETWEQLERRIAAMRPADFPISARKRDTSIASLAPLARPSFERMLLAARRAGHRIRVVESYRSPMRQAYLLVRGGDLTFTATSKHSAGHALDIVIGDGNLRNPRTKARWIAFRAWVAAFEGGRFRIIGEPGRSWDWPHVELAAGPPGFGSIEALLAAATRLDCSCCEASGDGLQLTHDPARSGAAPLARPGSGGDQVRLDGQASGPSISAR